MKYDIYLIFLIPFNKMGVHENNGNHNGENDNNNNNNMQAERAWKM